MAKTIDTIQVAMGVDLSRLETQIQRAKNELDTKLPKDRKVTVTIAVKPGTDQELLGAHKHLQTALNNVPASQRAVFTPQIRMEPTAANLRNFRIGIERAFRQGNVNLNAIKVPVRFNGDIRGFRASIETAMAHQPIEVPVVGRWQGGGPGGHGGGPGGGGGAPPTRPPTNFPSGPARGTPAGPARGAPERPVQSHVAPAPVAPVRPPPVYPSAPVVRPTPASRAPRGRPVEVRSSDVYETEEPTIQQARQTRRQAKAERRQAAADARRNARVDIGNVRGGSIVTELQGEERTAAISQGRARQTPAAGWAEQPGERQTVMVNGRPVSRITPGASRSAHRRQEEMAQRARAAELAQLRQSPEFEEALGHAQSALRTLNPQIGEALAAATDPGTGSFESLLELTQSTRAGGSVFRPELEVRHGEIRRTPGSKATGRGRRRAGGFGKGDVGDVDPSLLLLDAAVKALHQARETALNPLAVIQTGDTKRRGKGGKVGQIGGFNAGRLASMAIEPATVQEILDRKAGGETWKSLAEEFKGTPELSAARAQHGANRGRLRPVEPIVPGQAYGGGGEYAAEGTGLGTPGGQGLFEQTSKKDPRGQTPARFLTGEGEESRDYSHFYTQSPGRRFEAMAHRRGIPLRFQTRPRFFAEGGLIYMGEGGTRSRFAPYVGMDLSGTIPARFLRGSFQLGPGEVPRAGSKARMTMEERFRTAVQNRARWEKKPAHQQGGGSQPAEYRQNRKTLFDMNADAGWPCAICGQKTIPGDKGPLGRTSDHKRDQSETGGEWDHGLNNLQILCNRHNGMKAGGRSARDVQIGAMAEGGSIKHAGLLSSAGPKRMTMVGERGRELIVEGHNGEAEVIPTHKVPGFLGKMGHAQEGARFQFSGARGLRNATQERMSRGTVSAAEIVRVFVTNWPTNLGLGAPAEGRGRADRANLGINEDQATGRGRRRDQTAREEGAPAEGRARTAGFNPVAQVEARRAGRTATDVSELTERIGVVRAGVSGSLQEAPVRALSVAFGQIAQQMIGGRSGILERGRKASGLASVAQGEVNELQRLRTAREELTIANRDIERGLTEVPPEDQAKTMQRNRQRIEKFGPAIEEQGEIAEQATRAAEAAEKTVLTRPQQFKAQAVGLGGIIGGTALFSAAIAATSFAADAAAQALGPMVDQTLGWASALNKTSSALADDIQQLRSAGALEEAVARQGMAAGFGVAGAAGITGQLSQRAEAMAAARIQQQAAEQTRGAVGAMMRPNQGLFNAGTGGFLGGPLFAEQMGGQPGFMEAVSRQIEATAPTMGYPMGVRGIAPGGFGTPRPSGASAAERAALRVSTIDDLNDAFIRAAESAGAVDEAFTLVEDKSGKLSQAMVDSAANTSADAKASAERLKNEGYAITGPGGRALQGEDFLRATRQLEMGRIIADPGLLLQQTANQRRAQLQGIQMRGNISRQDIPVSAFMREIARPTSRFGTTFQTGGQGLELNAEGQKTLANVEKYSRLSAMAQSAIADGRSAGQRRAEAIVSNIDRPGATIPGYEAPEQQRRLGPRRPGGRPDFAATGPGPAVQRFRMLTGEITKIGTEIQTITDNLNARAVTNSVKDYNEQIRISNRGLQDARDLWAGIHGSSIDTLGGLQGQNIALERQNTLLSRRQQKLSFKSEDIGFKQSELQMRAQQMQFEMTQRQINFQVAVAGFTAPGVTPAERAARIEEAKLEAEFAQKQLDLQIEIAAMAREQLAIAKEQATISREMFANQVQQQDNAYAIQLEEARRAIPDLEAQLNSLFRARAFVIDQEAAAKTIEDLEKMLDPLQEEANILIEEGKEIRGQAVADIEKLGAVTGKTFNTLVGSVTNAWTTSANSYITEFLVPVENRIRQLFGSSAQNAGYAGYINPGGGIPEPGEPNAAGGIHMTNGPTSFIAGEAGAESVVVLRNVRPGMLNGGGGGGGGGTLVNVGGIHISLSNVGQSAEEINSVADRLAAAVELRLNRKLGMIAGGGLS